MARKERLLKLFPAYKTFFLVILLGSYTIALCFIIIYILFGSGRKDMVHVGVCTS